MNPLLFLLLVLLPLLFFPVTPTSFFDYRCDSINTFTGNFTANSTYQSNLNTLFSALQTNATATTATGFAAGRIGTVPNQVSGLVLCRGDIDSSSCSTCLSKIFIDILATCGFYKTATMWHDLCYLQFSNQDFLSLLDNLPLGNAISTSNVTGNQTLFFEDVTHLMSEMTSWAISNSTKFFATGEVRNVSTQLSSIYGLLQCTPNMIKSQCQILELESCAIIQDYQKELWEQLPPYLRIITVFQIIPDEMFGACIKSCLQNLINQLTATSDGKDSAWSVGIYCNIRYDVTPFYDGTSLVKVDGAPPSPSSKPILPSGVNNGSKKSTVIILAIVISSVVAVLSLLMFFICLYKKRLARRNKYFSEIINSDENKEDVESFIIGLSTLKAATLNFDESNKLGEGGFGAVYKGTLPNGQEVAVKRLSQSSSQGLEELRNELVLVAKLKHKNLVRVLGVCLEGQEKLLVYEFLPNRSLDTILFDRERMQELDWIARQAIINGISRGLQYLHEDSQLKIIHRDLKASNILLDSDMNPKISDFGLARLFPVDQTVHVTRRVVGTFGYMAPEYAMHGRYSIKSDVFSFGVLLLEIITGKRSSGSFDADVSEDLLGSTWENWTAGTIDNIFDLSIDWSTNEIIRYIHIGLLCVQEDPKARPRMSDIVIMLGNDTVSLTAPSKPAFYLRRGGEGSRNGVVMSQNDVTISELEAR